MHNQCDKQVHTLLPLVMICSSSGEHPHFSATAAEWLQEFRGGGEVSGVHYIEQERRTGSLNPTDARGVHMTDQGPPGIPGRRGGEWSTLYRTRERVRQQRPVH